MSLSRHTCRDLQVLTETLFPTGRLLSCVRTRPRVRFRSEPGVVLPIRDVATACRSVKSSRRRICRKLSSGVISTLAGVGQYNLRRCVLRIQARFAPILRGTSPRTLSRASCRSVHSPPSPSMLGPSSAQSTNSVCTSRRRSPHDIHAPALAARPATPLSENESMSLLIALIEALAAPLGVRQPGRGHNKRQAYGPKWSGYRPRRIKRHARRKHHLARRCSR